MSVEGLHPKTAVTLFLERYLNRAVTTEDIKFVTRHTLSGRFFTALRVPCFNSQQYFGEADTTEEAEKIASARFLEDPDVKDALENLAPSLGSVKRWMYAERRQLKTWKRQGLNVANMLHEYHCSLGGRNAIRDGRA